MNNLNSVLLEGIIESKNGSNEFCIRSKRHDSTGIFTVYLNGALATSAAGMARIGQGVRVVGRLTQRAQDVCITAEHIEYRPEPSARK
jgi:RPA family protein